MSIREIRSPRSDDSSMEVFWAEIAPREHLVQIYPDERLFLDSLERFAVGGLRRGESVVIIATRVHRAALDERLTAYGIDLDSAKRRDQYISLDAAETLSTFMVDGWPDTLRFRQTVSEILRRAGGDGRRIRAFGEMVALLWAQGNNGATVRLEYLWHQFCEERGFSLFCAYPQTGFTQDSFSSMKEICSLHSKVVNNRGVCVEPSHWHGLGT